MVIEFRQGRQRSQIPVVPCFGFVFYFAKQERSTKSHESTRTKVSCGFVDRLTSYANVKIRHHPNSQSEIRISQSLYPMHGIEQIFALGIDMHAELLTFNSKAFFQFGGRRLCT
jgi:hypothetical protein